MANRAAGEERLQLQAGADPEHGSVEGPDLLAETLEHRRVVRRPGSVRAAEDDGFGAGQVTGVLVVDAFDRDPATAATRRRTSSYRSIAAGVRWDGCSVTTRSTAMHGR